MRSLERGRTESLSGRRWMATLAFGTTLVITSLASAECAVSFRSPGRPEPFQLQGLEAQLQWINTGGARFVGYDGARAIFDSPLPRPVQVSLRYRDPEAGDATFSATLGPCVGDTPPIVVATPVQQVAGPDAVEDEPIAEVQQPPPPARVETPPPPLAPGAVWIPGYWNWSGTQFVWTGGAYQVARTDNDWHPFEWRIEGRRYVLYRGHWHPRTRGNRHRLIPHHHHHGY